MSSFKYKQSLHKILLAISFLQISISTTLGLPKNFVFLRAVDPTIVQEMRYAGYHNFVGRPIAGYQAAECVLTREAASALHHAQQKLLAKNLSLKVYDCYRPQRAVNDFTHWGRDQTQQQMKAEFYPRIDKKTFSILGYVAMLSGHSRGSTLDVTIVKLPLQKPTGFLRGQALKACFAPIGVRYGDSSIDMGSGYDCMDPIAHGDYPYIHQTARHNRLLLRQVMLQQGFMPYPVEWWHFTLKNEPYPNTYFDFPIKAASQILHLIYNL